MADIMLLNEMSAQNLWWQQRLAVGGHQLRCCTSLRAARRACRQQMPALMLVDLLYWRSNGFSLVAALQLSETCPVVLLSARQQDSDALWAARRDISLVLPQPSSTATLLAAINTLLGRDTC